MKRSTPPPRSIPVLWLAIAGVVIVVLVSWLSFGTLLGRNPAPTGTSAPTATPVASLVSATPTPPPPTPTPVGYGEVRIEAVGDVLLHGNVIRSGLQSDGTYDFSRLFRSMRATISAADVALADFEGTLGGTPYLGYPMFSAPDAIATAMAQAGFDMVTTANNHAYDRGLAGLQRTVTVLRSAGLSVIGTRVDPKEPVFTIVEKNGIRIAFTAYTFETPSTDGRERLNGILLATGAEPLIDTFNPYATDFSTDIAAMAAREKAMRAAGADITVFVLHWGDEYHTRSDDYQKRIAQALADAGTDIVFGCHPHVVEEIGVVPSSDGTHQTVVYYSMGNFVSNMALATNGTENAEDGIIAGVTVRRGDDGKTRVVGADYLPIYTYKPVEGGLKRYETILSSDPRAGGSLARVRAILAGSTGTAAIPVVELKE